MLWDKKYVNEFQKINRIYIELYISFYENGSVKKESSLKRAKNGPNSDA